MEDSQRRIQEFALGGVPSPPLTLKSRVPLKPARGSGQRCKPWPDLAGGRPPLNPALLWAGLDGAQVS